MKTMTCNADALTVLTLRFFFGFLIVAGVPMTVAALVPRESYLLLPTSIGNTFIALQILLFGYVTGVILHRWDSGKWSQVCLFASLAFALAAQYFYQSF